MSSEKARHVGMIAHIDYGKTSLTAAIARVLQQQEATPPMSSDVKIPEWAREEAAKALGVPEDDTGWHMTGDVLPAIALALLAAEQRGRKAGLEEAAKVAEELPLGDLIKTTATDLHLLWKYSSSAQARSIAAAIRSLGEKI